MTKLSRKAARTLARKIAKAGTRNHKGLRPMDFEPRQLMSRAVVTLADPADAKNYSVGTTYNWPEHQTPPVDGAGVVTAVDLDKGIISIGSYV